MVSNRHTDRDEGKKKILAFGKYINDKSHLNMTKMGEHAMWLRDNAIPTTNKQPHLSFMFFYPQSATAHVPDGFDMCLRKIRYYCTVMCVCVCNRALYVLSVLRRPQNTLTHQKLAVNWKSEYRLLFGAWAHRVFSVCFDFVWLTCVVRVRDT